MNKKMINLGISLWLACAAGLMAASCTDEADDGATLPDGKYPMTFTAAVDGLVATRATTDNTWTEGDKVAIQIAGNVKEYAAASNGNLTVASGSNPFYWQSTANITVNAWYPYSASKPADTDLRVKANQGEGNNYQSSDYLEAADAAVAFNNPELAFKHRTAKVVVTLAAGEGVTGVADATVTFVNQNGVESGTEVTPKKETPGGTPTYTALVIPQDMQGKKFIKVTVGTNTAARDYYYTPTNGTDADLEAGKQYTYTITVKKTGLAVEVTNNGTAWTDALGETTTEAAVTYHITAPREGVKVEATSAGGTIAGSDGSYTLTGGNVISITATSTYIQSIKGLYEVAGDGTTYTLKSDLLITGYTLADARVGDFYCKSSDGSTGYLIPGDIASLTKEQKDACLGVVMKVGKDDSGDWKDDCNYKLKDGLTPMSDIHGYVLALKDGNSGNTCAWGSYGTIVDTDQAQYTLFCGYSNMQKIKDYVAANAGKTLQKDFPAAYYASEGYEQSYPSLSNSSGWFLPSAGQCWYWYKNKDLLLTSMQKAGGNGWQSYYWSSSESDYDPAYGAWFVSFDRGYVDYGDKANGYGGYHSVRSSLAF